MSDSRDLVLDFWKNKGTYIEKYGWAYSKEDIKVLLTEVKRQSALEELEKLLDWELKCKNINLHTENSVPIELIEQRLKWLKEGEQK
jgi:geranylgeranyl pyrophosphate synthase